MANSTKCPNCGKPKKPWFKLCFECNEKEKQKPTCEVCGIDIQEGHTLCLKHWQERKDKNRDIKKIKYVKSAKEKEFKEKFEGKYYFNSMKIKSKSELLICYFLYANDVKFTYEPSMDIEGEMRPDFVIEDNKGNIIILEHFGGNDDKYIRKKNVKIRKYTKFCNDNKNYYFIQTDEEDIKNLKDKLGKKFNDDTPLNKALWR